MSISETVLELLGMEKTRRGSRFCPPAPSGARVTGEMGGNHHLPLGVRIRPEPSSCAVRGPLVEPLATVIKLKRIRVRIFRVQKTWTLLICMFLFWLTSFFDTFVFYSFHFSLLPWRDESIVTDLSLVTMLRLVMAGVGGRGTRRYNTFPQRDVWILRGRALWYLHTIQGAKNAFSLLSVFRIAIFSKVCFSS